MSRHVLLDSTWSRQQFLIFDCMYNEITLLCFAPYMTNHEAVPIRPSPNEIKGFLKAHIQAVFCLRVFLEAVEKQPYKLGCANKDLWALCAPIFIIVVYCRTSTNYFSGGKK